ncbi:hypothetical protein A0H81_07066 [Grifola frondosa]|uniref:Uncharacterized protein n=1 Tax=Grifola frondosa TaxID=5627 RepID=A0A1C7MAG7_GRIFR|nr:hypothetical protein A0H81_07066 [Grifola frondosa]
MLNRFLAGILHPLIHTGYGCEFGLLGMIAEGLAQTAVHGPTAPVVIHPSLRNLTTSNAPNIHGDVHALSIVARILADPSFSHTSIGLPPPEGEDSSALQRVLRMRGDALLAHVQAWPVDGADAGDVERKIEELFWMNALFLWRRRVGRAAHR